MKAQFCIFTVLTMIALNRVNADWSTPVPISELNTVANENNAWLSYDGLTMYFDRGNIPNGTYWFQLYTATRPNVNSPFTNIAPISELSANTHVWGPAVSQDGLRLYFTENWQFEMSTRASTSSPWSAGTALTILNAIGSVESPHISPDELTIVFDSPNGTGDMGGYDMYIATRSNTSSPFGNIRDLSELNSSKNDYGASLSADGLTIYFCSDRSGQVYCYQATRAGKNDPFGNPQQMSFPVGFACPTISADGKTMLLGTNYDLYVSTIPEPATLLILSLGGIMLRRMRGRQHI
jgi:hypothetical protein